MIDGTEKLKVPSKFAKSAARYNEFRCKYKWNKNLGLLRRRPFGSSRDEPLKTSAWVTIKTWALGDDIAVHVKPVIQRYELEKREESFSQGAKSCGCDFVKQPAPYNCKHVCAAQYLRRNKYTTTVATVGCRYCGNMLLMQYEIQLMASRPRGQWQKCNL